MQGGPRRVGKAVARGKTSFVTGTMKLVYTCCGTTSIIFSAGIKGDSATRLRRSQVKPVLSMQGIRLSSRGARSMWSAIASCSNCFGVMLKENTNSSIHAKTDRMLTELFKFNSGVYKSTVYSLISSFAIPVNIQPDNMQT